MAGKSVTFGGVISAAAYLPTTFKIGRDHTATPAIKVKQTISDERLELPTLAKDIWIFLWLVLNAKLICHYVMAFHCIELNSSQSINKLANKLTMLQKK